MRNCNALVGLLALMVLALTPLLVSGQANDDPHALVEAALSAFRQGGSYAFAEESTTLQKTVGETDTTVTTTRTRSEGQVQDTETHRTEFVITGGASDAPEAITSQAELRFERIVVAGETYISFELDGGLLPVSPEIAPGWWRIDDLITAIGGETAVAVVVRNFAASPLPSEFSFEGEFIDEVTEVEPQTIRDIETRVFDVTFDALEVTIANARTQVPAGSIDLLRELRLLEAGEFSSACRLFIGAEDGLVHRGECESRFLAPYRSAEIDGPPFDFETQITTTFDITQHGVTFDIQPPAEDELNP